MSVQISLTFLEVLTNLSSSFNQTAKYEILNTLVAATQRHRYVATISLYGTLDDVEPFARLADELPKIITTDAYDIHMQRMNDFNRNILFVAVSDLQRIALWHYLNTAFVNIQDNVRGIFVVRTDSGKKNIFNNLQTHFEWCWHYGFTNVVVLREHELDAYTYRRFPQLSVIRFSLGLCVNCGFVNDLKNFYGHRMRTAIQYDPPRVMEVQHAGGQQMLLKGYAAELFLAFLEKHNGSYEQVAFQNSRSYNIIGIMELLRRGELDVSVHPYMPYGAGVRLSYPIKMMQWCILVPFSGQIHAFQYFLRPFQLQTWQCFICTLLYLCFMKAISDSMLRRRRNFKVDLGLAFLHVLGLMLFLPTPIRAFCRAAPWHCALIYAQIIAFGFMLSNLYLASLTSFLAKLIFEPQINDFDEMLQHSLSLHAIDYEIFSLVNDRNLPKGFADLLVPRAVDGFMRDLISLNNAHAYVVHEDLVDFILFQQQYLRRPLFHVAQERITTVPFSFLLPTHSQFERILNHFILRAASAGLTYRWFVTSLYEGLRAGIFQRRTDLLRSHNPLNLEHFQFAWLIIAVGNSVALLVFIIEKLSQLRCRLRLTRLPNRN